MFPGALPGMEELHEIKLLVVLMTVSIPLMRVKMRMNLRRMRMFVSPLLMVSNACCLSVPAVVTVFLFVFLFTRTGLCQMMCARSFVAFFSIL